MFDTGAYVTVVYSADVFPDFIEGFFNRVAKIRLGFSVAIVSIGDSSLFFYLRAYPVFKSLSGLNLL